MRFLNSNADLNQLFHPPFETFGLDLKKVQPWLFQMFSYIDSKATILSDNIEDTKLAVAFYGSLTLFFNGSILLNRFQDSKFTKASSEGQGLNSLVVFMMGRQMSRIDVLPALHFIWMKLGQSKEVMADLLPNFVVDALMSNYVAPPPATNSSDNHTEEETTLPHFASKIPSLLPYHTHYR